MAKQYYVINYPAEQVLQTLKEEGWIITASENLHKKKPIAYKLQQGGSETFVRFYPGVAGPPMFDMRHASEDDCDLIDQFEAIGENDFFSMIGHNA